MSDMQNEKVVEKEAVITKPPPKYKVMFFNDDFTPFDFVIAVLIKLFNKTQEEAISIAQKIHEQGSSVVGVYTREIAETKTDHATHVSQKSGFPLKIEVHKE